MICKSHDLALFSIYVPTTRNDVNKMRRSGMHLGCAIGQMAQKNCHGRTFRRTVRPSWRTYFPSGALFENVFAQLSHFLYI